MYRIQQTDYPNVDIRHATPIQSLTWPFSSIHMATRLEIHWEAFTLTSPLRDDCVEGLGVFSGTEMTWRKPQLQNIPKTRGNN